MYKESSESSSPTYIEQIVGIVSGTSHMGDGLDP